jgi:hypothetical protein
VNEIKHGNYVEFDGRDAVVVGIKDVNDERICVIRYLGGYDTDRVSAAFLKTIGYCTVCRQTRLHLRGCGKVPAQALAMIGAEALVIKRPC